MMALHPWSALVKVLEAPYLDLFTIGDPYQAQQLHGIWSAQTPG
jgi:hypothetical protein